MAADKREREKQVVALMISLYCRKKHHTLKGRLCPECEALLSYAHLRSDRCPFMETKTFCSNCQVHCYKPEMREKIREERRHEFVTEHKRYFDILRWKTAEKVLNEPGNGINKDEKAPIGDYTVEQFLGQNRTFDASKHYLWPIPQSARDKNPNLGQNPNW